MQRAAIIFLLLEERGKRKEETILAGAMM